jgi:hypothetical protein
MIGIYKITNPKKRVYIAQSVDIERRFKFYKKTHCIRQPKIYNSLKKYGAANHKFEVIIECTVSELNELERYYQDLYQCIGKNGLNLLLTNTEDKNGRLSEETRRKLSIANRNRIVTEETRAKLSFIRKNISNETRLKMSIAQKSKLVSPETRFKMSIASKGKKKSKDHALKSSMSKQKIILDFHTGVFYNNSKEICILYGFNLGSFRQKMSGKRKNKTQFKYA